MHRDLGFSNSSNLSRGRKRPFSCVARKKEQKRLQHLFRAYTRKGVYGGRIKLVILIKSKIPFVVCTTNALRVRFRGYTAPLRMTRVLNRKLTTALLFYNAPKVQFMATANSCAIVQFMPSGNSSRAEGSFIIRGALKSDGADIDVIKGNGEMHTARHVLLDGKLTSSALAQLNKLIRIKSALGASF